MPTPVDPDYRVNVTVTRMRTAVALHDAIHALGLRAQAAQPSLTPEQTAKRIALIETMIRLLKVSRDDEIHLALSEWSQPTQEELG